MANGGLDISSPPFVYRSMDKKCPRCKLVLPLDSFPIISTTKKRKPYCRKCVWQSKEDGRKKEGSRSWWQERYRSARKREAKKGRLLKSYLSFDAFVAMHGNTCVYCGCISMKLGLDRKDNEQGYIKDNVVPCCKRCNKVKGADFSYEEMLILGTALKEIDQMHKSV
jgi:hypothetical protein